MSKEKIGIGLIGCGMWGVNHARVLSSLDNVHLVGVYDKIPSRTIEVSERYPNCRAYPSLDSVLSDSEVKAVVICTPTSTHYDISKRSIEAAKHCLIEKPVTKSVETAIDLKKLAEEKGVQIQVGYIERFNPAIQQAVRMVKEGYIGDLVATHHRRLSPKPIRDMDVGVVLDLMIHEFDIATLFGNIITMSGVIYYNEKLSPHEIYAASILKYDNKRYGYIESSWISPSKIRTLEIFGLDGSISVEYINQDMKVQREADSRQIWFHKEEPLKKELEAFADSIINDIPTKPNIDDGIRTLKLCEAFMKTAHKGLPVKVEYD